MKRTLLFISIAILCAAGWASLAFAQSGAGTVAPVELTDQTRQTPLDLFVQVLVDPGGQLKISDIDREEMADQFSPSEAATLNFSVTPAAVWLRFTLDDLSQSIPSWLLEISNATLEHADLYLPDGSGGYREVRSGLLVPDAEQELSDNHYLFEIPPGLKPDQPIYLRFATSNSMTIPLTLWEPRAFELAKRNAEVLWGIYYGIILVMMVYNGLLYLSLRDRDYLYLTIYTLAVWLQTLYIDGRIKDLLPASMGVQIHYLYPFFTILPIPTLLLFSTSFLQTRQFSPRLYKFAMGLCAFFGLLVALSFVASRYLVSIANISASFIGVIVVILTGLVAWRKKYRPARYFLFAMLVPLLFAIGDPLSRLGLIPVIPWFYRVAHFGNAVLVTILSLALADRINYYRRQTEQAYEEVRQRERVITEYMDALPIGVAVYGTDVKPRLVNRAAMDLFRLQSFNPENDLDRSTQNTLIYPSGVDVPVTVDELPVVKALKGMPDRREDLEVSIDGRRIPLEIVARPILADDGKVQYAISAFQDISQRREQEKAVRVAQELYQSLVEQDALMICRFDSLGLLTFANRTYCEYFALDRESVPGSSFWAGGVDSGQWASIPAFAQFTPDDSIYSVEVQVKDGRGETRWLSWTIQGFFDEHGEIVEYQATGADVTENIQTEEQLRQYRENLEVLVAERTSQERRQRAIAESLQRSASVLNSELNLDNVLEKILDQLPQVIPLDSAAIYLKEAEQLVLSNATGFSPYEVGDSFELNGQGIPTVGVLLEAKPIFYGDMEVDGEWADWATVLQVRSWMGAPLLSAGQAIGVLTVSSATPGVYGEASLPILEAFANHAAIAITNARLYRESRLASALEERNRLARDLHDSVTQTLFSASIIAEALPIQWQEDREGARLNLVRLRQLASGALAEMRMLLFELRPGSIQQNSLSRLVQNLCEAFQAKNNLPLGVTIEEDRVPLPTEVKEAFYRIAQEVLTNIAKHSKAGRVSVLLRQPGPGIVLQIEDDGRGFDPQAARPGHMGIDIMRERAAAIQASLQIESPPGGGTTVRVEWTGEP